MLSEVARIIEEAQVPFVEPLDDGSTKGEDLRRLLLERANIATTHKLYSQISLLCREGLLDGYHIVIDEVPNVCEAFPMVQPRSWQEFYVGDGYVDVDPGTGKVSPTTKWDEAYDEVADTLDSRVYRVAKSGCLFLVNGTFLIWVLPSELLTLSWPLKTVPK